MSLALAILAFLTWEALGGEWAMFRRRRKRLNLMGRVFHAAIPALAGGVLISIVFGVALFVIHVLLDSPIPRVLGSSLPTLPFLRTDAILMRDEEVQDADARILQISLANQDDEWAWRLLHVWMVLAAWGVHVLVGG